MKQTVEVFLTGINFILFYCSDSIIELSTAKSTDYVSVFNRFLSLFFLVDFSHFSVDFSKLHQGNQNALQNSVAQQ